jgi:enamine deaminase RidA (YjgF/YER057c/UK114 family)
MEIKVRKTRMMCMIKPIYQLFNPAGEGNFEWQWHACFDRFQDYLTDHPALKAFTLRIFTGANNENEFQQCSLLIKDSLSGSDIPFSVLSQCPVKPYLVLIEAGFADTSLADVTYGQAASLKFSKLTVNDYAEYWFAGAEGHKGNTISDSAGNAFGQLYAAFLQAGLGFNNIVRQWNYVEQIFSIKKIDHEQRQNYQLFNETRGRYYSRYRTLSDFPAATGIGVDFNGVTIECMLVKQLNENLRIIPVSNPRQVNSFLYAQSVLKGAPPGNQIKNQAPQFERARLMTDGSTSRLFISGTASIIGQQTIGINDVKKQTLVTIDNLEQLTSNMNLKSCCPGLTVFPEKYVYIRVYVKHEQDIPDVKALCLEHFGQIPMSIVQADICRSDLLVEIEGEKIS